MNLFNMNVVEKKYELNINEYGIYCYPTNCKNTTVVSFINRNQVYEPETIKYIIENCGDGDIVHAGTYFGDFLPALSKNLKKNSLLWAFEPNSESYKCAKVTTLLNDLENVKLFNNGLGFEEKNENLWIKNIHKKQLGGGSQIVKENSDVTEICQIVKLDNKIPPNRKISIIHLDVEGFEGEAIKGSINIIKRNKPILILEDNKKFIETEWFINNIVSLGYVKTQTINNNTIFIFNKEKNNIFLPKIETKTKYFVISLPRTGTTSLSKMANMCGLKSQHAPLWSVNHTMFGKDFNFFSDTPVFTPEYIEKFCKADIDAKFIYIDRNPHDIFLSWEKIGLYNRYLNLMGGDDKHATQKFDIKAYQDAFNFEKLDENSYERIFQQHKKTVLDLIKKYNKEILIYKFSDGWKPFCEFIDCKITDNNIPHLNKNSMFDKI